jgi:hypothetical protein
MRDPENSIRAALAVKISDAELQNGADNICQLLSAFSKTPLTLCSDTVRDAILKASKDAGITAAFVQLQPDGSARILGGDLLHDKSCPVCDLSADDAIADRYLEALGQEQIVVIPMAAMYILRSVATVYEWDRLLAGHFIAQYRDARKGLTDADRALLTDVRYGRQEPLKVKELSATAYAYLRLERKLFLQYPAQED